MRFVERRIVFHVEQQSVVVVGMIVVVIVTHPGGAGIERVSFGSRRKGRGSHDGVGKVERKQ